eukprot:symbB.v1.2.026998.t1/scaffold2741.1/size74257/2
MAELSVAFVGPAVSHGVSTLRHGGNPQGQPARSADSGSKAISAAAAASFVGLAASRRSRRSLMRSTGLPTVDRDVRLPMRQPKNYQGASLRKSSWQRLRRRRSRNGS